MWQQHDAGPIPHSADGDLLASFSLTRDRGSWVSWLAPGPRGVQPCVHGVMGGCRLYYRSDGCRAMQPTAGGRSSRPGAACSGTHAEPCSRQQTVVEAAGLVLHARGPCLQC